MAIKKFQTAAERSFLINGIGKIAGMPKKLIKEAIGFISRNRINGKEKPVICEKCLQAHIMKKAQDLGVRGEIEVNLVKMLEYKTGHYGYYLDSGELIKV